MRDIRVRGITIITISQPTKNCFTWGNGEEVGKDDWDKRGDQRDFVEGGCLATKAKAKMAILFFRICRVASPFLGKRRRKVYTTRIIQ
jgi:hypothetical protein